MDTTEVVMFTGIALWIAYTCRWVYCECQKDQAKQNRADAKKRKRLKSLGESMNKENGQYFIDVTQDGGLIDRQSGLLMRWSWIEWFFKVEKGQWLKPYDIGRRLYREVKRSEPADEIGSTINKRKYLKLCNGDIYDVETNSILKWHNLRVLLERL